MLRAEDRPQNAGQWEKAADLVLTISARAFGVPKESLASKKRCQQDVAFARQVAMYILHTTFGGAYKEAGDALGRERTTVAYACSLVEDRRDDILFDRKLISLEETAERLWAIECLRSVRLPDQGRAAA